MTATLDAPALVEPEAGTDAAPRRRSSWSRWRVAFRLGRRQAWRAKGSSALVMLLVLLPVTVLAGGAIFWQSHIPTAEQTAGLELGRNESWIERVGGPDPSRWQAVDQPWEWGVDTDEAGVPVNPELPMPESLPAVVPADATRELRERGTVYVETAAGIGRVEATSGATWDPVFTGRFTVIDGEAPTGPAEAMASPGLLVRTGATVGDEVRLVDSDRAFLITGTMRRADAAPEVAELFLPASAAELVDTPPRWFVAGWQPSLDELGELNRAGFIAYAHDLVLDPPPGARTSQYASGDGDAMPMITIGLMVAAFMGYLVVLLAGAAFAVSARRQQRSLAVAASVGADRRDVFRVVAVQGTALGAVAGVAGIAAGAGLAWIALELTDTGAVSSFWGNWGYNVPWPVVIGIGVFAVVVGTLAAVAPARAASRGDVIGALRGARRPAKLQPRRPLWGSILMIAGLATTVAGGATLALLSGADTVDYRGFAWLTAIFAVILGPVILQIGIICAGHWILVAVAKPLARIGLAPRLAGRDAAASPSRVVPAFAAIAGCVFVAAFTLSATALTTSANTRGYYYNAPVHSIVVGMGSGVATDDHDALLAAAEDVVASTDPRETAVIQSASDLAYDPETGQPDPDGPNSFGVAAQATEGCPSCGGPLALLNGQLSILDEADLRVVLDRDLTDAELAAFRTGGALATQDGFVTSEGTVEVTEWTVDDRLAYDAAFASVDWEDDSSLAAVPGPTRTHGLDATVVDLGHGHSVQVAISPETAEDLGIVFAPNLLIATYDERLPTEDVDRIMAAADGVRIGEGGALFAFEERGPDSVTPWLWGILAAAAVLVVGASAVCLGLARFERRPDDATLSAVGGGPVLRRNVNAWQAAVIVGIGSLVGASVGVIPVWGLSQTATTYFDFADTPWLWLGLLAIALPIAVTAVAWLVPPRRPELTRRTAIT